MIKVDTSLKSNRKLIKEKIKSVISVKYVKCHFVIMSFDKNLELFQ